MWECEHKMLDICLHTFCNEDAVEKPETISSEGCLKTILPLAKNQSNTQDCDHVTHI